MVISAREVHYLRVTINGAGRSGEDLPRL